MCARALSLSLSHTHALSLSYGILTPTSHTILQHESVACITAPLHRTSRRVDRTQVCNIYIIGQEPVEGTGLPADSDAKPGMLSLNSPIWASDHRGVVAKIAFSARGDGKDSCAAA